MSAFILDKSHIDALVMTAWWGPQGDRFATPDPKARRWDRLSWYEPRNNNPARAIYHKLDSEEEAVRLGELLMVENIKSINYRYPDTVDEPENMPGPVDQDYLHEPYTVPNLMTFRRPTAIEAIVLTQCYEYQSCEHPEWKDSEAHAFCQALISDLISMLPGYAEAPWTYRA